MDPLLENGAPISFAQQQIWLHSQMTVEVPLYVEPVSVYRVGPLDVNILERSLYKIIRRHQAWRTTFDMNGEEPVQVVQPAFPLKITTVDLRDLPSGPRDEEAGRIAREQTQLPFNLKDGPLLRATLMRLGDERYRLELALHHLIFDGLSIYQVFLPELAELYDAYSTGRNPTLPELKIQYPEFSRWQRTARTRSALASQLDYWRKKLAAPLPTLELPTDRRRPPKQTFRGALRLFGVPEHLAREVFILAQREHVTPYMVLLAAFSVLLRRYAGQDDFVVGTTTASRKRSELWPLLGCFQNPVALRIDASGNCTFREFLKRVRTTVLEAITNDEVPFQQVVAELEVRRDPSRSPVFQTLFAFVPSMPAAFPGWEVTHFSADTGLSKFDLYLELEQRASGLHGRFIYNTDLFDAATIARMESHFITLLSEIAADPARPIAGLPLMSEVERHRLLVSWNETATAYPSGDCVHQLFRACAAKYPDHVALRIHDQQITYSQLNCRANQLARFLRNAGVDKGRLVAVSSDRSADTVISLLAILKAGAAYVFLDSSLPLERLSHLLSDVQPVVVLSDRSSAAQIPASRFPTLILEDCFPAAGQLSGEDLPLTNTPDDLAYIAYTSGSTGEPNGVAVPHRAIVRLLFGVDYAELNSQQVLLQMSPIGFDASTFEIWGALLHGGCCVLFPDRVPTAQQLRETIRRYGVTTLWLTASLFNTIVDEDPQALQGVRQLLTGGEALSPEHIRRAYDALPEVQIINGYGPTEGTTFTCCYRIPRPATASMSSVPIGRPISNTQVYVLDSQMQPVPIGVPGELYIGGVGLARGYWNRPELTAERFVPNPHGADKSARLYKTGDLGRYLASGDIEFLGRTDSQVKLRGFRIEPGEVESVLCHHAGVAASVVTLRTVGRQKHLVAYFVPKVESQPSAHELREFLASRLPDYMVPSFCVRLNSIPLTANGKVDRESLPAPEPALEVSRLLGARDDLERRLVALWEDVLGVAPIATDQDFFDVGGNSLAAVQLMHRIQQDFKRQFPLTTLFEAPTIEKFAALLRHESGTASWSSLVPIQPAGSKPVFYCVHGIGGTVLGFRELGRYVSANQPLYGLQAQGFDGRQPCLDRVEDMATHYISEIRSFQPRGPYYLGGFSFGGLIAFEMAQQLHQQGEEVPLVVIFDTSPEIREPIATLLFRFLTLAPPKQLRYVIEKVKGLTRGIRQRKQIFLTPTLRDVRRACRRAFREYSLRVYPGRVALFRPSKRSLRNSGDLEKIWRDLAAGGLEIRVIAGDHLSIFAEPGVRHLGATVQACLDAAQAHLESASDPIRGKPYASVA